MSDSSNPPPDPSGSSPPPAGETPGSPAQPSPQAARQLFEMLADATLPVNPPTGTRAPQSSSVPDLPLPEELTALLPHGMYRVDGFLGQGGMGAVYKGAQVRLKRDVAIKIMRRDFGRDYDFEQRFEREAQAMARLNHPNIVSVIDYGEAGPDYLYIVMELVDGADMMDVIRTGRMTQEMALTLLPQICDALQFAHDHGIVHRDIKPSNIMLTRDGRIKMADFGLAKRFDVESSFRTQTGTGMGTPDYAAPEQFKEGAPIDHRADIYALGVMIYQMITGELPRGVWRPPSQRAACDPQWDDIVSHAMQAEPADRYQQASQIKTDVRSITPHSPPVAGVSDPGSQARKHTAPPPASLRPATTKSRAPLFFGLVTGAIVLAVGGFFAFKQPEKSGPLSPLSGTSVPSAPEPAQGAEQTTLPASSPSPDSSASSVEFPPGQWVKMFTKFEDLPELLRKPENDVKIEDGWIDLARSSKWLSVPPHLTGNYAVKARFRRKPLSDQIGIRRHITAPNGMYLLQIHQGMLRCLVREADKDKETKVFEVPVQDPPMEGDEYVLEFGVVGDRLIGRCGDLTLGFTRNALFTEGIGDIIGRGPVRDVEVMNLEGLPEAEALRLLGVDENGKDVRGADRAAGTPATSNGPAATSAATPKPARESPGTPPPAATKDAPFINSLGMKFVPVPGTGILMCIHETRKGDYAKYAEENPVKDGWKNPMEQGVPVSEGDDHPVVNVSWDEAKAFCSWLGKKESLTYRLPTDREWSLAVGIADDENEGLTPEVLNSKLVNRYPWGTADWRPPKDFGNYADTTTKEKIPSTSIVDGYTDGYPTTAPVMSFKPDGLGLYDLSGNATEWCEDWFNAGQKEKVLRGGGWHHGFSGYLNSSGRNRNLPKFAHPNIGFRCVVEASAKAAGK